MCVTRAGRVASIAGGRARVEFFDGRSLDDVDLSLVKARKGEFVEVFGNMALTVLTASEARIRKKAWAEIRKAVPQVTAGAF